MMQHIETIEFIGGDGKEYRIAFLKDPVDDADMAVITVELCSVARWIIGGKIQWHMEQDKNMFDVVDRALKLKAFL